jgi:hypothetical protein
MKRFAIVAGLLFGLGIAAIPVKAAELLLTADEPELTPAQQAARDATREQLRADLQKWGSEIHVDFRQSDKNPYNFVGSQTQSLKNAQSLEIVISVTKSETLGFRIYPHYAGGYVNLDKAKDPTAFAHQLLQFSDTNFMFWGADDTNDVFSGYTITLESGFPDEALHVVLTSIANTDKFFGQMRPAVDGTALVP